jgi:adenylate cyclase
MVASTKRKLLDVADSDPFSIEELAKHIDPLLRKDLRRIQIDTLMRKRLTVVFWDISGFSALCNDLNDYPEAIILFLKEYFTIAIETIQKNNGVLDKFIGDGIFAYFGYNDGNGTGDPYSAIKAAIEFKRKFRIHRRQFNKNCREFWGKEPIDYNLKCGIHTGPAFLHYFSTSTRNSIILMGPTINFANRLESIAKKDEIIVSNQLRNIIQRKFKFSKIMIADRVKEESMKGKIKSFEQESIVYSLTRKNS